ncbi:hypothetical protein C8Q78DRAFT_1047836 [Trametes maxima]|nr:hypothetical protein C8Q78DRAFT_1047836 [Trametes maxima]
MASPTDSSDALSLPLALALIDRSVTVRGSPKRPPPPQPLSDRAQQRLIRQAIIQAECEAEERDALRITAEELQILRDSVKSVKAEFADLDGLSWDTPAAQQFLQQWHAGQASRNRASSSSPSLLTRSPLRRINAPSALSFPASSTGIAIAISPATAPAPGADIPDTSFEDTIRLPRCSDSRRSSTASTIVPDRDDARTPLPALFASLNDAPAKSPAGKQDKENDAPRADDRSGLLPKSHSAPEISLSLSRPTKPLPPSRIPILRSKSLSAKPSRPPPESSNAQETAARRASSLRLRRADQDRSRPALAPLGSVVDSACALGLGLGLGRGEHRRRRRRCDEYTGCGAKQTMAVEVSFSRRPFRLYTAHQVCFG